MLYICSFFNKRNKRKFRKTFKLSVEVCIVNTNSGRLSRFTARRLLVILWNGIKSNANDKFVLSGKSCNGDRGPIHFSGKIYLFHIIEKKINEDTAWSVPFLPTRPLWIRMLQACSMYGKLRPPPPRYYPQKYYYMIWLNDSINYRGDHTSESYFSGHKFGQVFVLKKKKKSQNSFY